MFRKSLYACAFFVLILSLGTSYGATSNILVNPGFENGTNPSPWTARGASFQRYTTQKYSGRYRRKRRWNLTGCNTGNDWCDGFDFNRNGSVELHDLKAFTDAWLSGIE
jgi:hypothetical protein